MTAPTGMGTGYSFGPREPDGALLGLRGTQWTFVLAAGVAVLVLLNNPGWLTFLGSATVIAVCLFCAFYRLRGRTVDEYLRIWVNVAYQRWTGNDVYRGGLLFRLASDESDVDFGDGRPPGLLGAMRFPTLETTPGAEDVVVPHDPSDGSYVAVLVCQGQTLQLLEAGEQNRRVAAYGQMLAALCREDGIIVALQIMERTLPDSGDELRRDWEFRGQRDGWAAEAYEQTLAAAGPRGQRHETYIALAIDARKAAREIANAGGGEQGAAAVAFREANRLAEDLRSCGVTVLGHLPPRGLGYVVRTAFDPASATVVDRRGGGLEDVAGGDVGLPSGVDLAAAWPSRAVARWDFYRTDSAYHFAYWVLNWPQRPVPAAFLSPLLLQTTSRRSVSLLYEPRTQRRANREVIARQSKTEGEAGVRARLRLRVRRRHQAVAAELDRREDELMAGHGLHRLRAVITVSAPNLEELEVARAEVETLAAQSYLEIRPLYGDHDQGFMIGALPLARRPR
jgi:hypothetical protein